MRINHVPGRTGTDLSYLELCKALSDDIESDNGIPKVTKSGLLERIKELGQALAPYSA